MSETEYIVRFFEEIPLSGPSRVGFEVSDQKGAGELHFDWPDWEAFLADHPTPDAFLEDVRANTLAGAEPARPIRLEGDPWAALRLLENVRYLGFEESDLDAITHETKAAEASAINNRGMLSQAVYLAAAGVTIEPFE